MTTPYYADEFVTLYHGDCLEVREWLAAGVLVTDPPYGISWTRSGVSRTSRANRKSGNYRNSDSQRPEHKGILGDGSTLARDSALELWGDRPAYVFGSLLVPPPIGTKQVAIYRKPKDAGRLFNIGGIARDVEAIYLLGRHTVGGGGRTAVFGTAVATAGAANGLAQRYGHPHAKPGDVLQELIILTPSGSVIADPFAGSGSTLVAAKALGRRAIGVELEERYCEIAARRLAQDVLDFTGEAS